MVLNAALKMLRLQPTPSVVGRTTGCPQIVRLEKATLAHVLRYRQVSARATEAGGQLFGLIKADEVHVIRATGPYAGDERSRYRHRSNPAAAQRAIDAHSRAGLLYLGEWHSHAEDRPSASSLDRDAMKRLIANSRLNSNVLLMLIVGRAALPEGVALFSVTGDNAQPWSLSLELMP